MAVKTIDSELLNAALEGLENRRQRIISQIEAIRRRIGSGPVAASSPEAPAPGRTLSAAARRRIAAAQKKRWAAYRKESKHPGRPKAAAKKAAPPRKRRLSAAGRKAIAEAARKRWAAHRKEKAEA